MSAAPVVFLMNSLELGGSEKKTVNMANALAQRGHDVQLLYLNGPETLLPLVADSVATLALKRKGKFDWKVIGALRAHWQRYRPAAVWAVNPYPMLYLYLSTLGRSGSVRTVASINTTEIQRRREKLQMALYAPIARRMDTFVFGSEAQRTLWVDRYRLRKDRSCVIYNGVDTSSYDPTAYAANATRLRQAHDIAATDVWIGMVAQFRPEKAHEDLLEAVAPLIGQGAPVKVLFVGAGVTQNKIQSFVAERRLGGHVVFAGELNDVRPALSAMDVFVLPSRAVETFSNAALEAMAMGKPVVLSRVGGAAEMVDDGVTGLLYPAGDTEALRSILERFLDADVRIRYAERGYARVRERFAYDGMVDAYETALNISGELVSGHEALGEQGAAPDR